jgi:hypothetical protein
LIDIVQTEAYAPLHVRGAQGTRGLRLAVDNRSAGRAAGRRANEPAFVSAMDETASEPAGEPASDSVVDESDEVPTSRMESSYE